MHLSHVLDLMAEDIYRTGNLDRRAMVELGGARTMLTVPLRKDDVLLGEYHDLSPGGAAILRQADALLQNFAAQAVIAMENARLIHRAAGGAGAADRDRRGVAGHQRLARQSRAGVRRDAGKGARICVTSPMAPCDL